MLRVDTIVAVLIKLFQTYLISFYIVVSVFVLDV